MRFKDVQWLNDTRGAVDLDLCARYPSSANIACRILYQIKDTNQWILEIDGQHFLEIEPIRAVNLLLDWGWKLPGDLLEVKHESEDQGAGEKFPLPKPVVLTSPLAQPIVLGKPKLRLRTKQFKVLEATAEVYPSGLSKTELKALSGVETAVNVFKRIRRIDDDYAAALLCPGKANKGGYRLCWPEQYRLQAAS